MCKNAREAPHKHKQTPHACRGLYLQSAYAQLTTGTAALTAASFNFKSAARDTHSTPMTQKPPPAQFSDSRSPGG